MFRMLEQPRDQKPEVPVYRALQDLECPGACAGTLALTVVWRPQREKWFDQYDPKENLIFDEFRDPIVLRPYPVFDRPG